MIATVPGWNAADPAAAGVGVSAIRLLLLLPLVLMGGDTSL
jgi:hypothetical protein